MYNWNDIYRGKYIHTIVMNTITKKQSNEKVTKYYVSMTDKFMSGWGMADNRTNKLVIECDSYEEALIVQDNAQHRTEMKYINICINKPYYNQEYYLTNYYSKNDGYESWFKKGYFQKAAYERRMRE